MENIKKSIGKRIQYRKIEQYRFLRNRWIRFNKVLIVKKRIMTMIKIILSIRIFDYKMIIDIKIAKKFCKVFIDNRIDKNFVSSFLINE